MTPTPDDLWAEIASLVVLPDGGHPLMEPCMVQKPNGMTLAGAWYEVEPCSKSPTCKCHGTGLAPIPRSPLAALAAMGETGHDVQIRVWNGRTEVIIYKPPMRYRTSLGQVTPDAIQIVTYETILKALGAKEHIS